MRKALRFLLILVLLLAAAVAAAADVPYLSGRVTDNAEILSPETRRSLTEQLKSHEERTSNQIAVLTVPTIGEESIEDYAVRVFEAWKLGQKGKDNGVLIIVVPNDRRMRIEVGYGLEGTLTDGLAGRIIRNDMTPPFKAGDYNSGIEAGVKSVISLLEGGKAPEAGETGAGGKPARSGLHLEGPDLSITERILFGAFIFGIIGLFTVIGVLTPGVGWFLYFFLIPFWATFPIVVVGTTGALYLLITYAVGFPLAKILLSRTNWFKEKKKSFETKGGASIGGMWVTSGGSGGGSSFSSGSSFSGGGGSSGGGGASGSW
ncbi:MAG: TPM domain-containing protein [Syntrophales bacterium]